MLFLCLLLALPLLARAVTHDCSTAAYSLHFDAVALSPDPPRGGHAASWNASSTAGASRAVSGGAGTFTAALDGITVFTAHGVNACGASSITLPLGFGKMSVMGLACPVAPGAGPVAVALALELATGAPRQKITVKLIMEDQGKLPLYCLNATFVPA